MTQGRHVQCWPGSYNFRRIAILVSDGPGPRPSTQMGRLLQFTVLNIVNPIFGTLGSVHFHNYGFWRGLVCFLCFPTWEKNLNLFWGNLLGREIFFIPPACAAEAALVSLLELSVQRSASVYLLTLFVQWSASVILLELSVLTLSVLKLSVLTLSVLILSVQ